MKCIATLFIIALFWLSVTSPLPISQIESTWEVYFGLTIPLLICAYGFGFILRSKTTITNEKIIQSWIFNKEVLLKDIIQVKLIQVRLMSWILVPRLILRTHRGVYVFQTADARVLENFGQLAYGIKNTESK
jgi:hypothetical protein